MQIKYWFKISGRTSFNILRQSDLAYKNVYESRTKTCMLYAHQHMHT